LTPPILYAKVRLSNNELLSYEDTLKNTGLDKIINAVTGMKYLTGSEKKSGMNQRNKTYR